MLNAFLAFAAKLTDKGVALVKATVRRTGFTWGFRSVLWVFFGLCLIASLIYVLLPIPADHRERAPFQSIRLLDRHGLLLREVLSDASGSSYPVTLSDLPAHFVQATLAAEDKHFYSHIGIDFPAIARAAWQNLKALRVVSGASTITQQTARLMLGAERGLIGKIWTTLYALRLELHLSKDEILTEYFNRVPYGNQTFGIAAAAHCYFQKPPSQLTLAESALLAGLPQSPSGYDPFRHFEKAKRRQAETLRRMLANQMISEQAQSDALAQTIDLTPAKRTFLAPHFCDYVLQTELSSDTARASSVTTTLDLPLQLECERFLTDHLRRLRGHHVQNSALVVLDNHTGDILAMVGSPDYFNAKIDGAYNGATATRQPGSALKPFTYALALEKGLGASSIIPDLPLPFQIAEHEDGEAERGMFFPQNFDRKFHGPVRLRQALACSYNVTAVKLLEWVGYENLYNRLKQLGFTTLSKEAGFYGLGLTLGNSDVRLTEMVRAYSIFARGGRLLRERSILSKQYAPLDTLYAPAPKPTKERYFSPEVCYLISDILNDNAARRPSFGPNSVLRFPFAAACKTGTTKDYRDNWSFAVTEDFTVGVWVGNFDGAPMQNVSGVDGAGPIMRDVLMYLFKQYPTRPGFLKTKFDMPPAMRIVKVCPLSGDALCDDCPMSIDEAFIIGREPKQRCSLHRKVWVDTRNNLLATPNTPNEYRAQRLFEQYAPEYADWAVSQHKPLPPTEYSRLSDSLALAEHVESAAAPLITYPKPDMIFAMDSHLRPEFQAMAFTAIAPNAATVEWRLNGERIGETSGDRHRLIWRLQKGAYRLQTVANGQASPVVEFAVTD